MGNKARRIRSNKFAKKFATLREKAASRLGLLKEEVKEVLTSEPKEEAEVIVEKVEKVQAAPAKKAALKKKAPAKRKKKDDDA